MNNNVHARFRPILGIDVFQDDEIIEVVRIPFTRALEMITDGEIEDGKTIIGLMLAAPRVGAVLEADYPAV